MKKMFIGASVFFLVAAFACKPSLKNETNKWNENQKIYKELTSSYSHFESHLSDVQKKATAAYADYQKASGEEKKAAALAKANNIYSSDKVFDGLRSVREKNKNINDGIRRLYKKSYKSKHRRKVQNYIASAREKQKEANRILRDSSVNSAEKAKETLEKALDKLDKADGDIDNALNVGKKKTKWKKKKKKKKY